MAIDRSNQEWPGWAVVYIPAEKPEDRLTAEQGLGMVELVIDILRESSRMLERDEKRGHEDA